MTAPASLIHVSQPTWETRVVGWSELGQLVDTLAERIRASFEPDTIVGIFQGGWLVAQALADHFLSAAVVGAHIGVAEKAAQVRLLETDERRESLAERFQARRVLVVDEVVDSGKTLRFIVEHLRRLGPSELASASLFSRAPVELAPTFTVHACSEPINWILPWRQARDLPGPLLACLTAEPQSLPALAAELKARYGLGVSMAAITQAGERLRGRGLVRTVGKQWCKT